LRRGLSRSSAHQTKTIRSGHSSAAQEVERIKPQTLGDALDGLQGEIPLATLQTSNVGAVVPELVGERLLAQAPSLAVGAEVSAQPALKLTFPHSCNMLELLPIGLQTYK